jgi:hypothetical protein
MVFVLGAVTSKVHDVISGPCPMNCKILRMGRIVSKVRKCAASEMCRALEQNEGLW